MTVVAEALKSKCVLKGKELLLVNATSALVLFLCYVLLAPLVSPDILIILGACKGR